MFQELLKLVSWVDIHSTSSLIPPIVPVSRVLVKEVLGSIGHT